MSSGPVEFHSVCFGGQECVLCGICCCHFSNGLDGVTVGEETTSFRYSAHAVYQTDHRIGGGSEIIERGCVDIHSHGIIWYIPMIMVYKYK